MNKIKTIALGVFILALLACEQPFKAGLGPVVDIRPPTVTLTAPGAGSYIWSDKALFRGTAEDDYKLAKVELRVTNHPNISYFRDFTRVTLITPKPKEGNWECLFNTKAFPDGDLKLQIKVTDSVEKTAVTNEIAFYVKNQPPAISVSSPFIPRGDTKDGEVGGNHLNYFVDDEGRGTDPTILPAPISYQRRVDKGTFLSGSISDDEDIYVGEENVAKNRYPPQIRWWRVDNAVDSSTKTFQPGYLPTLIEVPWENFKLTGDDANLFALGVGNYQFAYSLPDESGCFIGFEIRAQGINDTNRTDFHYPRDYYPSGINWDDFNNISPEEKWFRQENRYVLLYIITPQSIPTVDLIRMQDILNPGSWDPDWNGGMGRYNDIVEEEPHIYVDKLIVNKNGSFKLRVKAEHPEGIKSAEVYWEKDSGERGRFIWDLANATPPNTSGWDVRNNVNPDSPYSHWGYGEQNALKINDRTYTTRNFIYTYNHGGDNILSADNSIHEQVRGKSKIQQYIGTDSWQSGKTSGRWPEAARFSADLWKTLDEGLSEGVYNIEVYARSTTETPMAMPFTCTIRLDRTAPEAEIINIDGAYSQDLLNAAAVVNGVIETRMIFSESLATDTGLRTATEDYYKRPGTGIYGYEQRYILVKDGDEKQLDSFMAGKNNWWPPTPNSPSDPLIMVNNTVTAAKHGPIFDSKFKFKTSPIYSDYDPAYVYGSVDKDIDALPDGSYWLYVFVRDNSFNVKRIERFNIVVDWKTDIPTFDFTVGEFYDTVKNPDSSAQTARASDSFWPSSDISMRNVIRSGSSRDIQIRITDDDSLDLGTAAVESAIEIWFTGSRSVENGVVSTSNSRTIQFSQEQVKQTFAAQETDSNGRKPLKERKGAISQSTLLSLLKANLNGDDGYRYLFNDASDSDINANFTNSLPDGIYRIDITIKDYSDGIRSKLKMAADDDSPRVAKESTYFWFAVDSTPPRVLSAVEPPTNSYYKFSKLLEGVEATVSERNGPITVTYTVTDDRGNNIHGAGTTQTATFTSPLLDPAEFLKGIWQQRFNAKIIIPNSVSGTYNVTLLVTDRFNNTTTINQRYMIDEQPPTVTLRNGMATVDRSEFEDDILTANELNGISIADLKRLANGVVRFQISADDNFSVTQLRWCLLPAGQVGFTFTNTETGKKADWEYYFETGTIRPANSVFASLTEGFARWNYINTAEETSPGFKKFPAGEYRLYAMAIDNSENISILNTDPLQTIYITQNSDIPFFGIISPAGGAATVAGDAVVRGTIHEDDGFLDATGNIRNGSIRVWASDNKGANLIGTPPSNSQLKEENPTFTGFKGPVTITSGLTRSGKNINLNLDLTAVNNDFKALFVDDGIKHYIIEATDSAVGKYSTALDGTFASDTEIQTRRLYYSFTYDINPPTIVIESPADGQTFSRININTLVLRAKMADTNLVADSFDFRLNTAETRTPYTRKSDDTWPLTDLTNVTFTISENNLLNSIFTNIAGLLEGDNTLYLTAYDKTGKEATAAVKFILDLTGPDVILNDTEVKLEDVHGTASTWWPLRTPGSENTTWYTTRRNLLTGYKIQDNPVIVPVIQRKATGTFITGTFVDELTNVDTTKFDYSFDGATAWTEWKTEPPDTRATITGSGMSVAWSVDISSLSDGLHSIKLRAYDVNTNTTSSEKIKMFAFRISGEQPKVAITKYGPGNANPALITTAEIKDTDPPVIIGNETGALDRVLFKIEGTASNPNMDNVNLIIRHADKSFSVDLVPARPATGNMGAITNEWTFDTDPAGSPTTTTKVTEKLGWSINVTRHNLLVASGIASPVTTSVLAEGIYELAVVSTDMFGLESEEAVWSFTVDRTSPQVTFTSTSQLFVAAGGADINPYTTTVMNTDTQQKTLTMANPVIQANIQDNLSNITMVQRQIRKYNYTTGNWQYYNFANPGQGADSWVAATSDNCWQTVSGVSGMDSRLEWELKTTPAVGSQGLPVELRNLEDGFYSIRYRSKDSSKIVGGSDTVWTTAGNGNPGESGYLYFFYAFKTPQIDHTSDIRSFSSRNIIPLGITVTDDNRFHTLTVSVADAGGNPLPASTVTTTLTGTAAQSTRTVTWSPGINIDFIKRGAQDDASYRIIYNVTDMAGRSASATRVIALDNTPPEGKILEPRLVGPVDVSTLHTYDDASEIKIGGEELTMNGTAEDLNDIAEIWFHLGYGHGVTNRNSYINGTGGNTGNLAIVPFPSEDLVKGYFNNDAPNSTPVAGSAWFQYKNGAVPLPDFKPMAVGSSLMNWELEMNNAAIGNYIKQMSVRMNGATTDTTYQAPDNATGPWMVQPIHPALPEQQDRYGGLYSLPLWVRIVDGVGNVFYICRDIWIYPNGDYPSGKISNPSEDTYYQSRVVSGVTIPDVSRGGVISVDGVATDNRSVRKVIYRVKADKETGTGWASHDGGPSTIVPLGNATLLTDDPEWSRIRPIYANADNGGSGATTLTEGGWYVVNLGGRAGDQSAPWDFTINANDEITKLIANEGFASISGGAIDTIRVRVELFVFDDNDRVTDGYSYGYNKVSLGVREKVGDVYVGEPGSARPYVRVFYLKSSAPKITETKISKQGSVTIGSDSSYNYRPGGEEVRGGQFAIQAGLDGNGTIGKISVRLREETALQGTEINRRWVDVYDNGNRIARSGISITPATIGNTAILTWNFDTRQTAASGFWHVLGGDWAVGGGTYTIEVRVQDSISPPGEASYSFEVGIDNFAPVADNRSISITNNKVAGTNMSFTGRVFDYYTERQGAQNIINPTHRGIDRVYAWFTQNQLGTSGYINMNVREDSLPDTVTTDSISARKGRTAEVTGGTGDTITSIELKNDGGNPTTVTYPRPSSTGGSTAYVKVLSADESGILANQITWQPTTVAGMDHDVLWNFITNTTVMPDGKMYLNYLVIDKVGNASYYQQEMVVMNNYPQITNITLRTNNMGVGAIFTTHEGSVAENRYDIPVNPIAAGYLNSEFISKNQGIAFGVETLNGNGNLNYRVQYVERVRIRLTNSNMTEMAKKTPAGISVTDTSGATNIITNSLYTVASRGNIGDSNWAQLGVPVLRQPLPGTHFVFQADSATAASIPDSTSEVWGYRVITTTTAAPALPPRVIENTVLGHGRVVSTTDTNAANRLDFEGEAYFGDTLNRIKEQLDLEGTSGDNYFLIKVWDTVMSGDEDDMLYDAVVVRMGVYLSDKTPPRARLYDLNPYTETAVIGNNINIGNTDNQYATMEVAADPTGIGENIKRGGLFNVKTERDPVKSGYIDPRSGTTALQPFIQNPITETWQATRANADGYVSGSGDSKPVVATATRDKVSGRVILRGYAWDDQFVREIRITIGSDTKKVILRLTPVDADGKAVDEEDAVGRKMLPVTNSGVLEPAFAYEELHWKDGHTVEWAYVWDTENYGNTGGVYRNGVTIAVEAIDLTGMSISPSIIGGLTSSGITATPNLATREAFNQITVDIVPYVVGFERQSIYANTRSRQGWYSFFQGETGVTLLGYNLGQGTTASAPDIKYATFAGDGAGTLMGSIVGSDNSAPTRFPFYRRYTFTVPDGAVSGKINVTAKAAAGVTPSTMEAYNHGSTSTNSWNKENYITGRELWNNKPHAHIWRTEQTASATPYTYFGLPDDTDGISRPSMALEYVNANVVDSNPVVNASISGRLTGVWASYGNADSYYARNDGSRRMGNTKAENDIRGFWGANDGGSNDPLPGEPYLAYDVSFYNGSTYRGALVAVNETDGGPRLYVRDGGNNNNTAIGAYTFAANLAMGPNDEGWPTQRWLDSRIVRSANRSHVVSYDSYNKNLRYVNRADAGAYANYSVIDGSGAGAGATGSVTASNDAGRYSAIDYDTDNSPIVAYYDTQNSTLRLAYASSENPAAANWTRRNVMASTDTWYSGSGHYVSMKVTTNGNIHLAFYNTREQTVVYAFAASKTATFTTYAVDRGIKGGTWTDISVDGNGNPVIVYGETARMGNYDGARMAYWSSGTTGIQFGTAGNINAWEAVTMPSDSKVKDDRLNIEAWPPNNRAGIAAPTRDARWGTWNAAIGYAGEKTGSGVNTFRIGYFTYPGFKGY